MKKIIYAVAFLAFGYSQAQIEVTTYGEPIDDNQIFTYSTIGDNANLPFKVENTGDSDVHLKIRVEEMVNSPGTSFQLCFGGQCFYTISEGLSYPPNWTSDLAPGEITGVGDHFMNSYAGDGTTAISFKFVFEEYDEEGVYIGDLMTISYHYVPQLGVSDLSQLAKVGIRNLNTLIDKQLNIDASEDATLEIVALDGKVVRKENISANSQSIELDELAPAMYIVRFTNSKNQSHQIKVIKK